MPISKSTKEAEYEYVEDIARRKKRIVTSVRKQFKIGI